MKDNFQILIDKLDGFIKKYYLNKIIKGVILSLSVYALWYVIIVFAEYFGRFSSDFRTVLFFISSLLFLIIFVRMILIPVLNLFKIGKTINYNQASKILGKHFPEIADKLQNTLELHEISQKDSDINDLVIASINQRTIKLSPIPFVSAIKLEHNLKYLKILVPIIFIIASLLIFWPTIISEATERIVNFNKQYETPAPFAFTVLNDSLIVKKGDDFTVNIKAVGEYSPDQVMIHFAGNEFYMEKESNGIFKYVFKGLNNDVKFNLSALDVKSKEYQIIVLPAPIIVDFKVFVKAPSYTNIEDRTYNNSGDISVPAGSEVMWSFNTANINSLTAVFDSVSIKAIKNGAEYTIKKRILKSGVYSLIIANDFFKENTGIKYQINVVPDLFPVIGVKNIIDTVQFSIIYYNGFIDDDYGFSNLSFVCVPGENSDTVIKINIPFSKSITSQDFYFAFDFASVEVKGRNISYYFEVSDNDAINGHKTSKTQVMEFKIPSADDLQKLSDETNRSTEEKIDEAKKVNSDIKKDIEDLQKKLINEQMTEWDRNQIMQQIFQNQSKLENLMDNISKEQEKLNQMKDQFSNNEELVKKQEEINQLMENIMDEEMKKLMEELQKLMQDFDKDEFFKIAEEMKFNSEEMEKQMDNTMELLKRTEVEERVENTINKLDELAIKQEKLSEESKNKDSNKEELLEKQTEQQKEFENLKEEYQKTLEKNSELKEPMKLEKFEEEMKDISDTFEQSKQELSDSKASKASKSQKQNSQQMQEMSQQMQSMMASESSEETSENMEDLRQIIENLISFSFDQEEILTEQKTLNARDPRFKEYIVMQKNAQDNFDVIRDSLNALASRIPELGPLVNKEQSEIYRNLHIIMSEMGDNRRYMVEASQQLVMTSANNLALLLSEVMEQMQQQMAMQMKSDKPCNNCKKPGQGKPGGEMRDIQQGMKQQMQDMINMMKQGGQNPGGQQSEQIAKMIMQQEMMQKMINDMMNSGLSPESAKILNDVNRMMDENLSDIVNGKVTSQTVNRQEQILTRLLQAENSDRERETEQKRKSNEAKDYKLSNPDKAFIEKEKEIRFNELLQMSNLKLNSFYKNKYKEYLKKLGQN